MSEEEHNGGGEETQEWWGVNIDKSWYYDRHNFDWYYCQRKG